MNIYQIEYLNQNNKLELYIGKTNKTLQQRKNDYIEKNNTISKYIKNNIKKLISINLIKENATLGDEDKYTKIALKYYGFSYVHGGTYNYYYKKNKEDFLKKEINYSSNYYNNYNNKIYIISLVLNNNNNPKYVKFVSINESSWKEIDWLKNYKVNLEPKIYNYNYNYNDIGFELDKITKELMMESYKDRTPYKIRNDFYNKEEFDDEMNEYLYNEIIHGNSKYFNCYECNHITKNCNHITKNCNKRQRIN